MFENLNITSKKFSIPLPRLYFHPGIKAVEVVWEFPSQPEHLSPE
jgi:hypothetical protein